MGQLGKIKNRSVVSMLYTRDVRTWSVTMQRQKEKEQ